MMGWIAWALGVGLPTFVGAVALFIGAWAWFRVPLVGHYVGLALSIAAVGLIAYGQGYDAARDDCLEASLAADLADAKKQRDQAIALQARHAERAAQARADAEQQRKVADALEQKFRDVESRSCDFSSDESRRLQRNLPIIGGPDHRPAR